MFTLMAGSTLGSTDESWIDDIHEEVVTELESQGEILKEHWKRVMLIEIRKRKQFFISLGINPTMQFCGDIKGFFRNTFVDAMVEIFEERKV